MTFATKNMKLRGRQFASACSKKHQRHSEQYTLPTFGHRPNGIHFGPHESRGTQNFHSLYAWFTVCSAISCGTSIVSSTHLSLAGANLLHHSTTESLPRCQISTPTRKCDSTGTLMLGIWERNRKEACVRRSKQAKFGPVLLRQSHVELRLFLQHISAWLERICCNYWVTTRCQVRQHRWCLEYGKGIERRHVWEEANKPNLVQSCSAISCGTSIVSSTHLSLAGANLLHSTTESLPRCLQVRQHRDADAWNMGKE